MRTIAPILVFLCILGAFVSSLTGCAGTQPSRFYQFSSLGAQTAAARDTSSRGSEVVVIGPLRIPDYLDRPQIVTRSAKNELKLAEFDRWAGSLESDVIRVLVENVSVLLPRERFFVIRWTPFLESQLPVSCKVELFIERFEGTPGEAVSLRAQWLILGADKRLLLKKESSISEQVNGDSYDALVAAMSKALERVSREIADGVMSSRSKGPG